MMFWDKGYTPSQNIESLLQKENVTVEELLEDEDILQECKAQKRNLVQYLTRPEVIKRLIEIVTTEPPEDVSIIQRFKHANVACEILTFGLPSLDEKLVDNDETLQTLYSYLENKPPLNPLLASFFSKTFSMLISKKSEQDWFLYQKMCLQVLEFIKSRGNFIELIFRHFETPVIMDLLLQIIREVQGGTLKKNLYEWLAEQKLVQRLISILRQPEESDKHKNVAEFICDLIRHGRGMRQTDQQENDAFERTFIGSNPLLQSIEDNEAITQLIDAILLPGAKESSIISGVYIVLTLVDETIVDVPASDLALQLIIDKEKENHEKIVATIIEVIEPKLINLHELLLNPPEKKDVVTTASKLSPPFGLTRLQICRLFTVLLRTGNSKIINAISKTEFLNTLLKLFKEYCWNNFLHSEVEKCLHFVFSYNDNNNDDNDDDKKFEQNGSEPNIIQQENDDNENNENCKIQKDLTVSNPSALQTYAIVNCRVISKLIDCWMFNKEVQSLEKGRRLGYMGHLIKIFNTIINSISESEKLGALIESNLLSDETDNWNLITDKNDGEFTNDLNTQNRMLANCNAYESSDFVKEFHNGNLFSQLTANMPDNLEEDQDSSLVNEAAFEKLCGFLDGDNLINCLLGPTAGSDISLNLQRQLRVWDSIENDMDSDMDLFQLPTDTGVHAFNMNNISPWGSDPFGGSGIVVSGNINNVDALFPHNQINIKIKEDDDTTTNSGWDNFMSDNNFADFDAHFNSFPNEVDSLGIGGGGDGSGNGSASSDTIQGAGDSINNIDQTTPVINNILNSPENEIKISSDNNANIEINLNNQNNQSASSPISEKSNELIDKTDNSVNNKKMQINDDDSDGDGDGDGDVNVDVDVDGDGDDDDDVISGEEIQENLSIAMEEMMVVDDKENIKKISCNSTTNGPNNEQGTETIIEKSTMEMNVPPLNDINDKQISDINSITTNSTKCTNTTTSDDLPANTDASSLDKTS